MDQKNLSAEHGEAHGRPQTEAEKKQAFLEKAIASTETNAGKAALQYFGGQVLKDSNS